MFFRRRPAPSSPPVTAPATAPVTFAEADVTHREEDLSQQVKDLALFALEHGVGSVVPDGGPLIPFTMVETATGKSLARFVGLDNPLPTMRGHLAASGAIRGAMAWDGYLTDESGRTDAIFVQASDAGCGSVVFAHRYAESDAGAYALGRPVLVSLGQPLL